MYSTFSLRCFTRFSLSLLILGFAAAAHAQRPLVILDPGHGGKDPGAAYALKEKTVNLQLALALERRLHDLDIDTAITRDRDVYLTLKERAEYASKFSGPKLFVSLHYTPTQGKGRTASRLSFTTCRAARSHYGFRKHSLRRLKPWIVGANNVAI